MCPTLDSTHINGKAWPANTGLARKPGTAVQNVVGSTNSWHLKSFTWGPAFARQVLPSKWFIQSGSEECNDRNVVFLVVMHGYLRLSFF